MAQSIIQSPIKDVWPDGGSPISLTTTPSYLWRDPDAQEVEFFGTADFRLNIAPRIKNLLFYDATDSSYTDVADEAQDGDTTTALTLSSMQTADYMYLRTEEPVLGFYFDLGDKNDNASVITVSYNISQVTVTVADYELLSGAILALYVNGVKNELVEGTDWDAATNNNTTAASLESAIEAVTGISSSATNAVITVGTDSDAYIITDCKSSNSTGLSVGTTFTTWTDTEDTDGTDVSGDSFKQDGLVYWAAKTDECTSVVSIYPRGYWYRIGFSAALDSSTTMLQCMSLSRRSGTQAPTVTRKGNMYHSFSMNCEETAGFQLDVASGTGTLTVNWIKH